jgi:putative ABC transport system permease protein
MFDYDKWQEIFQSIGKHKLRAGLTAFGVFWGIFMLILLMGAGTGLENAVKRNFDMANNAVFVWTRTTSMPYKGLQPGRRIQLKNADVEAIRTSVPEAAIIAPRTPLRGDFSLDYKDKSASFQVMGDYPEFLKIKSFIITEGRFVNDKDIQEKRKVACIGKRVAEVLYGAENPIGTFLEIKGVPFKVVGLFDTRTQGQDALKISKLSLSPIPHFNRPLITQITWDGWPFYHRKASPQRW